MKHFPLFFLIFMINTAYCWDFFYRDAGLGTGLYVGGNGSFGNFDFQLEEELFQNNADQELNFFDGDTHQIAEGGGFFVGYGVPLCDFRIALQFDGNWYGNEALHSINFADIGESFVARIRCQHLYDLTLKPGVLIGPCLLLNFKAGVSWAGIARTSLIIEDDRPNPIDDKQKHHFNRVGYVLGTSACVALTECLSFFVEYNWHRFSVKEKLRTRDLVGATIVTGTSGLARLGCSTFNFGLSYKI